MQKNSQKRFRLCKVQLQECSRRVKEVDLVCALGQTSAIHALCLILPEVAPKCRLSSWFQPRCHSCMTVIEITQEITTNTRYQEPTTNVPLPRDQRSDESEMKPLT